MGKFNDWFKNRNQDKALDYEYYEDTHNSEGEYTEKLRKFQEEQNKDKITFESFKREDPLPNFASNNSFSMGRNCQNVMVYEPHNADDVQTLIDFLKGKEPAIINLDNIDEEISQRVLDFVSGAIYALSGSVHRIAGNIFLLSPEGVEITIPYEYKENK